MFKYDVVFKCHCIVLKCYCVFVQMIVFGLFVPLSINVLVFRVLFSHFSYCL